jgi:hypothetical protein
MTLSDISATQVDQASNAWFRPSLRRVDSFLPLKLTLRAEKGMWESSKRMTGVPNANSTLAIPELKLSGGAADADASA